MINRRSSNIKRALPALIAALLGLGALRCSAADDGGTSHTSAGGAGGAGGSAGTGGIDVPDASGCPSHCAADLQSLVDCNGKVLKTCPSTQACMAGKCVDDPCGVAQKVHSTFGCDYYAVHPETTFDSSGGCYAAYVVNTWSSDVSIDVEYKGQKLDPAKFAYVPSGSGSGLSYAPLPSGKIPAGQVAILFLNRFPGGFYKFDCPAGVTPAITAEDTAAHGTTIGAAFHIQSSAPVVAYDMYPYGGGQSAITGATLLLPTSAWDTNYVAVDGAEPGAPIPFGPMPFVQVVAKQDGTSVTINPAADIAGGTGVAAAKKGSAQTYQLDRGQVLQLAQGAPLTGSIIQSSVPVGVWGGSSGLAVSGSCCLDNAHQQIPPVRALGSEYVGVRYRNRYDGKEESPPWRIVGAVDGTQLTWEPAAPLGAPAVIGVGQLVQFQSPGPFVVRSQDADHPFYVSAHMTGAGTYDATKTDGRGDPEMVNVIPSGQYLSKYVFFTDPTYPETNLVLVRKAGPQGFVDVFLDCLGVVTGWQKITAGGAFEYARIDLSRHNFQPQGKCDTGRHVIASQHAFGLTVWGWGSAETGTETSGFYSQYVSYAYPAGAGVTPINEVVIPPVK